MGREVDVAFTKSQWMKTNKTGRSVRDILPSLQHVSFLLEYFFSAAFELFSSTPEGISRNPKIGPR